MRSSDEYKEMFGDSVYVESHVNRTGSFLELQLRQIAIQKSGEYICFAEGKTVKKEIEVLGKHS